MKESKHHPPLEALTAFRGASRGPGPGDLGIVMGGGGARAAYQVGLLRCLARRFPELEIPYLTGVSAGAINAAHLAAHHGTFVQAVDELSHLWGDLRIDDVFRVGSWSLAKNALSWGAQLVSGGAGPDHVRGFVDTQPLREYLTEVLHAVDGELTGIQYNLELGRLKAIAISTSSYATGESVTWVQGRDIEEWERPYRRARKTTLSIEHVMASSALPLFFPAVQLENAWYGDGGMRLTEPLSPVIHLGARRVIAVSTRSERPPAVGPALDPDPGYPPPAQIVGVLMNSIFLDLLDADAVRVERINQLLKALPEELHGSLKGVRLLTLRPSVDLGEIAYRYEPDLPRAFRFMTRGLGTRATDAPDFLSLILFQPDYVRTLIDIGEQDAEARADEIEDFIFGRGEEEETVAGPAPGA